ncbi:MULTISPECIES: cation:proton antiporter [unclassified Endozoicomonas]|uniref:cation:proton antiporter n=1 Tax=unclassified Endozoicomonas TaxID=2644528 RepID=UPI003BB648D2
MMVFATHFAFVGLLASLVLAFIRLCKGPSLADRVIALDLIAFITIGFIGVFTIYSNATAFMDIAITLALVAFLSTIAFARFIMRVPLSQSRADAGLSSGEKS